MGARDCGAAVVGTRANVLAATHTHARGPVHTRHHNRRMSAPEIRRVLAAESVSNFGTMLSRLAIPWLAALQLQATPLQMAALLMADVVAAALGSLWLGSAIDRHGKRSVMLWADGARCGLFALLALAAWTGAASMPLLVLAAAASGLCTVAFELARSAWMAQCVAGDQLAQRNAQLSVAGSLSETAAFALGGWLYQGMGAALALLVDGLSYAASALCLAGVREVRPASDLSAAPSVGAWRALREDVTLGLHAIAVRPALRALVGIEALLAFSMALTGTSYMIYISRDVALPTGQMGMIAALGALGAVAGASLAPRLGRRFGPGWTMSAGLAAFALGAACIPMAQVPGWAAVLWLVAHQVVGDAGHTLHDVHDRTLRQTAVPHDLLARVDAGIRWAGQLAVLAGAVVGGLLGGATDARTVLWLAAGTAAAAASLAGWRLGGYRPGNPE